MKKILISTLILFLFTGCVSKTEQVDNTIEIEKVEEDNSEKYKEYASIWDENHAYNDDYLGQVFFESGLINEPVVQYTDNDYYLRKDFKTLEYSAMGTVFADYEARYDSQNITIYGHNAYSYYDAGLDENGEKIDNDTLGFTSLKYLVDESKYEENKTVYLLLENEIREYQIVSVFHVGLVYYEGNMYVDNEYVQYYLSEYSKSYFDTYKKEIVERQFYDTGIEFEYADKYLTLQTCVEGNDFAREVILCKEINRTIYR